MDRCSNVLQRERKGLKAPCPRESTQCSDRVAATLRTRGFQPLGVSGCAMASPLRRADCFASLAMTATESSGGLAAGSLRGTSPPKAEGVTKQSRRSNCRRPYEMNPPSGWGTGRCMREKVGRAHPTSHCGQVAFSPLESLVGWALPTSHVRTGVQAVKHGRDTHATHAANTRPPRSVR